MKHRTLILATAGWLALAPAYAQEGKPPPEDPAHEQLRTLRKELVDAVNNNDLDALLAHLDQDVVVTWLNGEVSRKPEGVRAYYDKMMKGDHRVVESITVDPTVEELTHLYGDTGVAYGSSSDHFRLTDGKDFVVPSRWSATLVRKNGKWLVANFHASTNMFDNPVLHLYVRRTALGVGGTLLVLGLILGFALGRFLRRRPPAAQGGTHVPPAAI